MGASLFCLAPQQCIALATKTIALYDQRHVKEFEIKTAIQKTFEFTLVFVNNKSVNLGGMYYIPTVQQSIDILQTVDWKTETKKMKSIQELDAFGEDYNKVIMRLWQLCFAIFVLIDASINKYNKQAKQILEKINKESSFLDG